MGKEEFVKYKCDLCSNTAEEPKNQLVKSMYDIGLRIGRSEWTYDVCKECLPDVLSASNKQNIFAKLLNKVANRVSK